jgi:hypothetical protein
MTSLRVTMYLLSNDKRYQPHGVMRLEVGYVHANVCESCGFDATGVPGRRGLRIGGLVAVQLSHQHLVSAVQANHPAWSPAYAGYAACTRDA